MAGSLILGAGLILLGYVVTDELFYRLRPVLRRWGLRGLPEARELNWRAYAPLPIAFVLAYLMREGPLISIHLIAIGVLTTLYYVFWRTKAEAETALNAEILKLVEEFQSYLNQFVYVLERSETARREVVQKALGRLIARLRRREQLRVETETNLTVITGQTQIILILGIGLLLVVALIPGLREVYTRSVNHQILFIVLTTIGVLTTYYIDRRVTSLKERVL